MYYHAPLLLSTGYKGKGATVPILQPITTNLKPRLLPPVSPPAPYSESLLHITESTPAADSKTILLTMTITTEETRSTD